MVTLGDRDWYWSAHLVCTHRELLKALSCFTDQRRQLVLEGTTKAAAKLLIPISQEPNLKVKSGFVWFGKPKFIAVQMGQASLDTLLQVENEYFGPELFTHCMVITNSEVLMEAYDAGNGEVLFSPLLLTAQINDFASLMKVKVERQEVS